MITAERYHDISAGHKVTGHESKCAHLHGHNYRVHFYVTAPELDSLGRVMDFGVIKTKLCMWLEDNWDHKFLMFNEDPMLYDLITLFPKDIITCSFNPTAENMAKYLCEIIAPNKLSGTGCILYKCRIEETRKCSASYEIPNWSQNQKTIKT